MRRCSVEIGPSEVRFEAPMLFGWNAVLLPLVAVVLVAGTVFLVVSDVLYWSTARGIDEMSLLLLVVQLALVALLLRTIFIGRTAAVFNRDGIRLYNEYFGHWIPVPRQRKLIPWSRFSSLRLEATNTGELRLLLDSRLMVAGLDQDQTRAVYGQLSEWSGIGAGRRPTSAST